MYCMQICILFEINDFQFSLNELKSQPLCSSPKATRITTTFRKFLSESDITFHTLSLLQNATLLKSVCKDFCSSYLPAGFSLQIEVIRLMQKKFQSSDLMLVQGTCVLIFTSGILSILLISLFMYVLGKFKDLESEGKLCDTIEIISHVHRLSQK